MFEPSNLARCRRDGYASRLFRLAGIALAVLWVFAILATGESRACPQGGKTLPEEKTMAVVIHMPVANISLVATAFPYRPDDRVKGFNCCGHCSGIGDANACCSVCAPALPAFISTLILVDVSTIHGLPLDAGVAPAKPAPDFRPPRVLA
jgi:hypothetical protein